MSIDKLKNKFSTGAFVADVKHYFSKINEIIDYLNNLVIPDAPSYKVYTAILNQTGTSAPVATVLENTLGATISFTRTDVGFYDIIASDSVFTNGKTVISLNQIGWSAGSIQIDTFGNTTSKKSLITSNFSGASADGVINTTFFEIRVYN